MKVKVADMVDKLHTIIDDVKRTDGEDDFTQDKDTELREALLPGADQIISEAAPAMLMPQSYAATITASTDSDEHCEVSLPDDFYMLYELRLKPWKSSVETLLDPGSQEVKMQSCSWTRGSNEKPRATMSLNDSKCLFCWPKATEVSRFLYIPHSKIVTENNVEYLSAALMDNSLYQILYRAAGIFMEAKKESTLADRFYTLSKA